jgi:thioesterase-3
MDFVSTVTVEQAQVDELGHLNHVAAVDILQYARDDWYQAAGLWAGRAWSVDEILGTLVLNININYRLECFLDEVLKVTTRAVSRGSKSFILAHEIVKADGRVAIDGRVTSLIMDMEKHETLPVPESLARYLPARQ